MPRADVVEMFTRLRELNPHPKTEPSTARRSNCWWPWRCPPQATDVGANSATRRLFPVANTPAKILALGEDASAVHRHHRAVQRQGEERDRHLRRFCCRSTAAKGGATAKRCAAARCGPQDRQWCSTPPSASR
jgi:hypothetical protein